MSKSKHKVYPKEGESKVKDANRSLKSKVKQLTRKVLELEAQNEQLTEALLRGVQQVKKATDKLTVEEVIKVVNNEDFTPKVNRSKEDIIKEMKRNYGTGKQTED